MRRMLTGGERTTISTGWVLGTVGLAEGTESSISGGANPQ